HILMQSSPSQSTSQKCILRAVEAVFTCLRFDAEMGALPARSRFMEARASCNLTYVFVKFLEIIAHCNHELIGLCAINDAVIIAKCQADDVADGNRVIALLVSDNDRFFEDAAHAQDCNLGLEDNGCAKLRAEDSRIGDGDGATLDFVWHEFFGASTLA